MTLRRTMTTRYSWDYNPQVLSEVINKECPTEIGYPALNFESPSLPQPPLDCDPEEKPEKVPVLLPLPPPSCPLKVLNRSNTVKGLRQDPFLLAYKQCTKSTSNSSFKRLFTGLFTRKNEKKKCAGVNGSELKRSDSKFSFKNSRADPLPRDKSRRLLRSMSVR